MSKSTAFVPPTAHPYFSRNDSSKSVSKVKEEEKDDGVHDIQDKEEKP